MEGSSNLDSRDANGRLVHLKELVVTAVGNSETRLLFLALGMLDVVPLVLMRDRRD